MEMSLLYYIMLQFIKMSLVEVLGVFAAARDITEIKKAEEYVNRLQDTLEEKVKNTYRRS